MSHSLHRFSNAFKIAPNSEWEKNHGREENVKLRNKKRKPAERRKKYQKWNNMRNFFLLK